MTSKKAINFKEYNEKCVQFVKAAEKTVKGDEKQKYIISTIGYNFGTVDKPIFNEFLIDFPPLKARGIDSKAKTNPVTKQPIPGVQDHTVFVMYNQHVPDEKACFEMLHSIHKVACDFVASCPKDFRKQNFSYAQANDMGFKPPCNYPMDKKTNELDKTRSPAHWLKCYERTTPFGKERTLFSGLDGKPIPWEKLRSVEMTFIPRMHVKSIYCGSTISLQIEMRSAVITDIVARNSQNEQTDVIEDIIKNNPSLLEKVSKQLESLSLNASSTAADKPEPKKEEPKHDVLSLTSGEPKKDSQQFSSGSGTGQQYPGNQQIQPGNNMQQIQQYNIPQQQYNIPQQGQQFGGYQIPQQQMMNPQQIMGQQGQQPMQPYQPNNFQNGGTAPIVNQPLITNLGGQMPNIPVMPNGKAQS